MNGKALNGIAVLVTRPRDLAQSIVEGIRDMGGEPVLYPGVEIEPVDNAMLTTRVARMKGTDMLIFVSPTAVRYGLPRTARLIGTHTQIAAVGQSTATELERRGITSIIVPSQGSGGGALLECPDFANIAQQRVLIVRGRGGSDVLETALRQRGASIEILECYWRRQPEADFSGVGGLLRSGRIGAWIATSNEILENVFRLAGGDGESLRRVPLFVNHAHVAVRAFSRGARTIFVTEGGDKNMLAGVATWFSQPRALSG